MSTLHFGTPHVVPFLLLIGDITCKERERDTGKKERGFKDLIRVGKEMLINIVGGDRPIITGIVTMKENQKTIREMVLNLR
mmetsp:Transcript_13171/g.23628  ORF Transcript_13171/g.23628 Transcript_13171/m.23628 type:complete len:81 (+) Transcript_13171:1664-1906(+)